MMKLDYSCLNCAQLSPTAQLLPLHFCSYFTSILLLSVPVPRLSYHSSPLPESGRKSYIPSPHGFSFQPQLFHYYVPGSACSHSRSVGTCSGWEMNFSPLRAVFSQGKTLPLCGEVSVEELNRTWFDAPFLHISVFPSIIIVSAPSLLCLFSLCLPHSVVMQVSQPHMNLKTSLYIQWLIPE